MKSCSSGSIFQRIMISCFSIEGNYLSSRVLFKTAIVSFTLNLNNMHTIEQLEEMLAEHHEWQGKINFYRGEIDRMKGDLASAVMADQNHYNMPNVEHYQNQFILQRDILDIMRHDFKQHENKIEAHSANPVTNLAAVHAGERENFNHSSVTLKNSETSLKHLFIKKRLADS